jgi:hypothetical protein
MAQVKLLKISADGVPLEFVEANEVVTFNTYTAQTAFLFTDPTTGYINQTAGNLIADDIMAKDRANIMASGSDILFGSVGDVAGELDAFKVPNVSALPTATPAYSSDQGYLVAYGGSLWVWDGTAWNDLGVSDSANQVLNSYIADEDLLARDVVYISANDNVSKALANNTSQSYAIGVAKAAADDTDPVDVVSDGLVTGYSGLTAGSRYYLSASNAGEIVSTIPAGSGNTVVQVGYAKSATALQLQILQLGRRA